MTASDASDWPAEYLKSLHMERGIGDVEKDLAIIRSLTDELRTRVRQFDDQRLLIALPAGPRSEPKLMATLPRMLAQVQEMGMQADVLLALDQDPAVDGLLRQLKSRVKEVMHLHAVGTAGRGAFEQVVPAEGQGNAPYLIGDRTSEGSRLFVVHRMPPAAPLGKNNSLRTVNDVAVESMLSGTWQAPPKLSLFCDDDSWMYAGQNYVSNGLSALVGELRAKNLAAIGARSHCTAFEEISVGDVAVAFPDPSQKIDAAYSWLDRSQLEWLSSMPGGATVGDSSTLQAIRSVIGHRYPGSWSDDMHTTMYVDRLGLPWSVASDAYVFNEARGLDQLRRWIWGTMNLKRTLGSWNFRGMYFGRLTLSEALKDVPLRWRKY